MATFQFNTDLTPKVQGTNLSDMINMARGVQQYQQAAEVNPLITRQQQATTTLAEETLKPKIQKETTEAEKAKFGLQTEKAQKSREIFSSLASSEAFRSGNRQEMLKEIADTQKELERAGFESHEALLAISPIADKIMRDPKSVLPFLRNAVVQSVSPESRLGLQKPTLVSNAAGQAIAANPVTGQYDVMGTPQTNPMGVRTQTFTDPATGNLIQAPVTPQGTLGAPSNLMQGAQPPSPDVAPKPSPFSQFGKPLPQQNVPQAIPQGATAETVKAQATDAMTTFMSSSKLLSDASMVGHIPTQEDIAKKLLTYIKDPKVRTGPIANALGDASKDEFLTPKEQEVKKLIQQRIQNLSPRTDADAESKRAAYGSFKLKKEALEDLIRDDLGSISNQKLLAQGVVKAGGDPNKPNLQGVNTFKNDFTKFSENRLLMKYIGIVGTKNTVDLDKSDEQALKKLYSTYKVSKEGRNALEDAREELIKMSAGGR